MSDTLEFKVSSALKNIVGRDLITNDEVAVFELVKNSYDAKARNVSINIQNNSISISDNGKGMTLTDIKDKWLFLAYSAKKDGSEDKGIDDNLENTLSERRYYAGAKGVGRFSADRLGRFFKMTTKTPNSKMCEEITLDWSLFDKSQKEEFTSIQVQHKQVEFKHQFPESKNHGTIIEISQLHNLWSRDDLLLLKRFLEKLINPFIDDGGFSIEIICTREKLKDSEIHEEYKKVNGLVKNTIIDVLSFKTTRLDQYVEKDYLYTEVMDRGSIVYKIREKNSLKLLDNYKVTLLFLNRAAKNTFTRRMGMQPVQYGSVLLYKNGVRVLPFGEEGDDSWKLDRRKQQGYNRYLGSRDIMGYISFQTDNHDEFKETTSRDGGLIDTKGAREIHELFKTTSRRLERYVVGVLWGEGFLRENYFIDRSLVDSARDALKEDQEKDDFSLALKNIGSRIDYTQIIKGLVQDENIEILEYNREMTQFLANELSIVKVDILKDVEEIAIKTQDTNLQNEVKKLNELILLELQKREEAEKKAIEEVKRRELAEKKAEEERLKKIAAEEQARLERIAKEKLELEKEAEKQRRKQAELDKREAVIKKMEAEKEAAEEKQKRKNTEQELEKETKQGVFQRSIIGKEKEQIIALQHQINHSSSRIKTNIKRLLSKLNRDEIPLIEKYISVIFQEAEKIESISAFVTSANFDMTASNIEQDIIVFFEDYINEIYLPETPILTSSLDIKIKKDPEGLIEVIKLRPLDITSLIDNFIQNSEKAKASTIEFLFQKRDKFRILISDNGKGIRTEDIEHIFTLGYTTTEGSGIGLYSIKSIVERMKGQISVKSELGKGTTFIIEL